MSSIIESAEKTNPQFGIRSLERFKSSIAKGNFKNLYIFRDGTVFKKKGKMFYRKVRSIGKPCIIINSDNFSNIPEEERRNSIAEDINNDLIWIQQMFLNGSFN